MGQLQGNGTAASPLADDGRYRAGFELEHASLATGDEPGLQIGGRAFKRIAPNRVDKRVQGEPVALGIAHHT